jgi:hypothetical protein
VAELSSSRSLHGVPRLREYPPSTPGRPRRRWEKDCGVRLRRNGLVVPGTLDISLSYAFGFLGTAQIAWFLCPDPECASANRDIDGSEVVPPYQ